MSPKPFYSSTDSTNPFLSRLANSVEVKSKAVLRDDPNGLWEALLEAHGNSKSTGITGFQAAALYTAVLKFRPRLVLELGAGLSSIVLGFAAMRLTNLGFSCEVHSWEESEVYFADLRPLVPDCLSAFLTISVAEPIDEYETPEWLGVKFPKKEALPYDLVVVDGPQYPEGVTRREGRQRAFDADVLDVLSTNPNRFVVMVDGRKQTIEALRELRPFGRWRKGRFDPISFQPPSASRVSMRAVLQEFSKRVLGGRVFPHTFKYWFVPPAAGR